MRIGIDIRPLIEPQPSGVGEYTRELLRAIFSIDRENEYHLFANAAKTYNFQLITDNSPNITLHRFRYPNKIFNASLRFFDQPKLDHLVIPDHDRGSGLDSRFRGNDTLDLFFMPNLNFAALSPDVPLVLTVHDLSFEHYPSFFSPKERLWHRMVAPRELAQRAAHLCAVSEHTKGDLVAHFGIAPERITVTYPGVGQRFFDKPSTGELESVRTRYHLPGNFILFLGTLGERKGVRSVLEAFELLKKDPQFTDLHLIIAGRNKNYTLPPTPYSLSSVHQLGYIPSEDRRVLYRLARAFVYPSYYEGFGLPPLEAMAAGTPVIASFASSLGEVIGEAGILIDPHNLEDLRRAMEEVLTDPALAEELAHRGRARAREFTWEKTARATLNVFQKFQNVPSPLMGEDTGGGDRN